jgi:uncharacterized protein
VTSDLVRPRVSPNAKRTERRNLHGGEALGPRIAAPPVDGKANAAVERLVAEKTGVPPSGVRVVRGRTVLVEGVDVEWVREVRAPRPR